MSLRMDRRVCLNDFSVSEDEDRLVWVSIIAIAFSLFSFIGIVHYFYGMASHLSKLQHAYDKRVKSTHGLKEKESSGVQNGDIDHEKKLMDKYKKTELENRRFRMRESGIDIAALNATMVTETDFTKGSQSFALT